MKALVFNFAYHIILSHYWKTIK